MKRQTLLLLITVILLSCAKNHPPVIQNMFSVPELAKPGDTVELHAAATDMDGDELTMTWYYNGSPLVSGTWQSPDDPGDFYIQLKVSDQIDMVKDSLLITVRGLSLFRDSRDQKAYRYVTSGKNCLPFRVAFANR